MVYHLVSRADVFLILSCSFSLYFHSQLAKSLVRLLCTAIRTVPVIFYRITDLCVLFHVYIVSQRRIELSSNWLVFVLSPGYCDFTFPIHVWLIILKFPRRNFDPLSNKTDDIFTKKYQVCKIECIWLAVH